MAEKAVITEQVSGTGAIFLADEFSAVDNTVVVPYTKIMDGSAGSTATMSVNAFGRAKVNAELTSNTNLAISGSVNARISAALPAGTNQIGKVELTGSSQVAITTELPAGTNQIAEVAPPRVVRKLLGDYILRGDVPPQAMPPATAIDWDGLQQDTERVVQLFDAYVEWVEDEEVATVLLLGEF